MSNPIKSFVSWLGIKHVISLIIVLYLVSLATGGFVLAVGAVGEWVASTAWLTKFLAAAAVLAVVGLIYWAYRVLRTYTKVLEADEVSVTLRVRRPRGVGLKVFAGFIAVLIVLGVVASVQGMFVAAASGAQLMGDARRLEEPIPVVMTRIIPLKTAYANALSKLTIPTHTIFWEETSILYDGNRAVFGWLVEPEGGVNSFVMSPLGAILFDGSDYPFNITFIKHEMVWGLHNMRFTPLYVDTLARHIKLGCIWCKPIYSDIVIAPLNGKVYVLIPLEGWDTGGLTSIPRLAAYAVVSEDGEVRIVPADKLMDDPVTGEALRRYRIPVVPETIAREWVEAMRWAPGVIATAVMHATFEIRDVGANPQPYLVFDDNGNLWWLFVAEPSGESYAVKYLIYVNASSPTPDIRIYEPTEQLIGPSRIANYVMKAHPTYDWSLFELAEPIPMVVNGTLYWKVTIITSDGRGVVSIDLVDARTGNVRSIPVEQSLTAEDFLNQVYGTANQTGGNTVLDQIRELKKRVQELINELQTILDELERLEEAVSG